VDARPLRRLHPRLLTDHHAGTGGSRGSELPHGAPDGDAAREVPIVTRRSARFYLLGGEGSQPPAELWMVLHGYGQLAGRFIRHFRAIATADRMVVAPEALNRFYVEGSGGVRSHADARVGATWMTREDREREIDDQQAYLDAVLAAASPDGRPRRLVVLGFSQGVATGVRWLVRSAHAADRVIAWAGSLPAELEATGAAMLAGRLTMVAGRTDTLLTAERIEAERARLRTLGVDAPLVRFDGGHTMDGATLSALASSS
jgi:predicted esterase